jgi:predicted alpha/beta hydrolase family esterase
MKDCTHLKTDEALLAAASRYDFVLVPGRFNSGERHWQSIWEQELPFFKRVTQRNWDDEDVHRLNGSLRRLLAQCTHPALLVGHSLGALASCCMAREMHTSVGGLLLVAPAEPARFHAEDEVPECDLGVPSLLVASQNDPFMRFARAEYWAAVWGSELVDLGEAGHINVESGFGSWTYGKEVLRRLVDKADASLCASGEQGR